MSETPGSKALSAMKNLQNTCIEFKKPDAPKKKMKPKILTEERYIEELSNIIQRDFFPDLARLKAQNEYLDAVDKNDIIKLREIYAKYSGSKPNRTDSSSRRQSPATFETPLSNASNTPRVPNDGDDINAKVDEKDTISLISSSTPIENCSLDTFLNRYTSEDNYSFQEIIDAADAKLKQKFSVMYNYETLSADKLAKALTLPNIEEQFNGTDSIKSIETWSYKNKNYIMYIPDGVDLTKEEKMEMANRRQEINYSNTRLHRNPFNESQNKEAITELAKSQAKHLTGKIGVDGNILQNNGESPKVGGFDFVKTPSPCPGETCTPLMTWGEIEGTPFRLDGSDTPIRPSPGPSFRINETSRRETLALELAEKAGERMRCQKQKALDAARRNIGSPYTRSPADRLASMSPAAKRLATMKLGVRSSLLTPSPRNIRIKSPSPMIQRKASSVVTDNKNLKSLNENLQSSLLSNSSNSDLTDDLLKIPSKRPKASDFF